MTLLSLFILLGSLSVVTGIILTVKGSPYNKVLSTIHKLASFAGGALVLVIYFKTYDYADLHPVPFSTAIITTLFFIIAVTTGSLLLSKKTNTPVIKIGHRIVSFTTYIAIIILSII